MKQISVIFASLLAASSAAFAPSKRQSPNYIKDGGFELVPKSDVGKTDFVGGDWTFAGTATIYRNSATASGANTPYGKQFAHMTGGGKASGGTFTQQLSGLPKGSMLTLEYKMRQYEPPYYSECSFNITLGSKTIESYTIYAESHGQIEWSTSAQVFKSPVSSGALTFSVYCEKEIGAGYDIQFDNLSLTSS